MANFLKGLSDIRKDLSQLLRSKVCRKVSLVTFLAILIVEIIILIPSYNKYSLDWQQERNNEVLTASQLLLKPQPDALAPSREQAIAYLKQLHDADIIKGWRIAYDVAATNGPQNNQNATYLEGGEAPIQNFPRHSHLYVNEGLLDIDWSEEPLWQPYAVQVRVAADGLQPALQAFVWRISGLVALISLSVTVATMLMLNQQVLRPVLDLYTHVKKASEELDYYRSRIKNRSPKTELGLVVDAFNQLLERIDHNLYKAQFDDLTHLPNRAVGLDYLEQAIHQAKRHQRVIAVMFIDLDHFKEINDTLGHNIGDQLLIEASKRLSAAIRAEDQLAQRHDRQMSNSSRDSHDQTSLVSRIGGDEFMIVLPEINKETDASIVAQRIIQAFHKPFSLTQQQTRYVGTSIGIALYPRDGENPSELLISADTALYSAKGSGRGRYQFFSPDMNEALHERLDIEARLRVALDEQQFEVYYQPVVSVASGEITGVEALIRWHEPEWGIVSPDQFIPVAESSGLINPIGEWVLNRACQDIKPLHRADIPLKLAVNVSYQQCRHKQFIETVEQALIANEFPAERLELEITESLFMDENTQAQYVINALYAQGVSFAIDDFGTGYSALSYLRRFSVNTLKIDRAFITGIENNPQDATLTRTIIAMADSFELDIVAEGVENAAQHDFLKEHGCGHAQGYHFSRPLPYAQLLEFLGIQSDSNISA